MAACFAASAAFGAEVEPGDYEKLLKDATATGTVRVSVTIDDTITLETIRKNPAALRAAMEQQAKPLIDELGPDALESGYWNNGFGQIGVYVTPNGLKILANSPNAKSFMPDVTSKSRFLVHDSDGSIDAIEAAINANGFADVEVFLNVDKGDYDIGRDGKTTFRPSPELSNAIMTRLANINTARFASGFKNFDKSPSEVAIPSPSFRVRIDKNAFYGLRESGDVRAIRPVGFVDARPAQWPAEALETAKANGTAEVAIQLRGGSIFSPKTGYMSAAAVKAQSSANQRAFENILSNAGASLQSLGATTYFKLGGIAVSLSYNTLARLYENADPRILSINLNKPLAWPTLTNSISLLNMQSAWNAGYRAAGQNIIVMDSGIRRNHEFFKVNGTSKVIYEACFGSHGTDELGVSYHPICPNVNTNGDSFPQNQPGTGEPLNDPLCSSTLSDVCSHGTHVAGVAAGHSTPNISPSTLQGVAPDAGLISLQVFSYNTTTSPGARAFNNDILAGLQAINAATVPGTNNPYVVNMSLGGGHFSGNCAGQFSAVDTAILDLTSHGVPVIVATGNAPPPYTDADRTSIAWPACVPETIKVSAVVNDANGTSLPIFAQVGIPGNFTGPMLLAPGGGAGTTVTSSSATSSTATLALAGTSMAAPHVAGIYAAFKAAVPGTTVNNISNWITSPAGSFGVTYTLPVIGTQTYRRVRIQ
jgi:subtilisin family serine protease